ncbi:hypothetical protein CC86DRAFT_15796 [Ophiobolus disseminans]|uniref:Survival motor neuron Tudor domain-containing protein n=1 Tax=Ophiobolus disseminans TaxID=1469910 RepID=A0A6A7AL19_9PLEO|nr:hypothetical protein CC86DRAFT_15796 [Ophiobolus disseminans]
MAPGVDMSNPNAWDDKYLLDSWNDAVKEYEKYHSIHKSGKRLEDALSAKELKDLREDYGEYIEETDTTPGTAQPNELADQEDTEMTHVETNGDQTVTPVSQAEAQHQEPRPSEQQENKPGSLENPAAQDGALTSAMPQAILGSVQDENLKNIMMSWYYAGYYTGLHAGQQQALKDAPKQ